MSGSDKQGHVAKLVSVLSTGSNMARFGPRLSTAIPHKAVLTEKNLPDQSGKVFIVTGGSGAIGKELVEILYQHNAKIYIAAREKANADAIIEKIKLAHPSSTGDLIFLKLQLDDLSTIKATAEEFLAKENTLDVLWNNAGVMIPPDGSRTVQGYELQLGVNDLGHFLLTKLLRPALITAARTKPKDSVRVIWVSSSIADGAPKPAIDFENLDYHRNEGVWAKYGRSKAGSALYSIKFARENAEDGIALNPGNFVTGLQQTTPKYQVALIRLISSHPRNGAYTELFAGLDSSITHSTNGIWVSPYGKVEKMRHDFLEPNQLDKYWAWSEDQVRSYL